MFTLFLTPVIYLGLARFARIRAEESQRLADELAEARQLAQCVLERAGVPASVPVLAEAFAAAQADAISAAEPSLPVQFLAMSSPPAPVEPGLTRAASALGASVLRLSVDEADVQRVAQRAQSDFKAVAGEASGDRWRDAGYLLLPLIALLALAWSRRGWVVR